MKCVSYCDQAREIELCADCADHYALQATYNSWKEGENK
jgi:hypothetical protein